MNNTFYAPVPLLHFAEIIIFECGDHGVKSALTGLSWVREWDVAVWFMNQYVLNVCVSFIK